MVALYLIIGISFSKFLKSFAFLDLFFWWTYGMYKKEFQYEGIDLMLKTIARTKYCLGTLFSGKSSSERGGKCPNIFNHKDTIFRIT